MTTLLAYQGEGWAVVGCDSRSSDESGRPMVMATHKIINNNGVLIAGSGAGRGSNIMQFGWKALKPTATDAQDLDIFVSQKFIPAMRKAFVDAGYDMKEDGDAAAHDSSFLIILRGVIYPIFEDYSWAPVADLPGCAGSARLRRIRGSSAVHGWSSGCRPVARH